MVVLLLVMLLLLLLSRSSRVRLCATPQTAHQAPPSTPTTSQYQHLSSVQGVGHSGSLPRTPLLLTRAHTTLSFR